MRFLNWFSLLSVPVQILFMLFILIAFICILFFVYKIISGKGIKNITESDIIKFFDFLFQKDEIKETKDADEHNKGDKNESV